MRENYKVKIGRTRMGVMVFNTTFNNTWYFSYIVAVKMKILLTNKLKSSLIFIN
jgi:hypothetical protein